MDSHLTYTQTDKVLQMDCTTSKGVRKTKLQVNLRIWASNSSSPTPVSEWEKQNLLGVTSQSELATIPSPFNYGGSVRPGPLGLPAKQGEQKEFSRFWIGLPWLPTGGSQLKYQNKTITEELLLFSEEKLD